MLQKAIELATAALNGITEENGRPYMDHAIRVMDKMSTEEEKLVAVLHDVVEDTEMTIRDLECYGFPRAVMDAVEQLTKRRDMTYFDYIDDISCSELAAKVKIAEIEDNKDIFRVNKMSFRTYSLEERAQKSLGILRQAIKS